MKITFMQTSDAARYAPLLAISSRTVKAYARKFGYYYLSFIGLRRGFFAWQASYNRIPMLMDMVQAKYEGWICYMDADSFIADIEFDLSDYLSDKSEVALIAAHSGIQPPKWFDVNSGVFLVNLSHPRGRELIKNWYDGFMAILENELQAAELWDEIPNDQILLHEAMTSTPGLEDHVIIQRTYPMLLNYGNGRFIRQILRTRGTIQERAEQMKCEIDDLLARLLDVKMWSFQPTQIWRRWRKQS